MLRWPSTQGVMGDDPPYLSVGTEVSAKYKGAFCEAKVRKVVRSVKCRVSFKSGLGTAVVTDDQIRGTLRVGSIVEVKHTEKKDYVEATISKIQDCSQYTVVFDDGDITTLRRTALCLKSGRHFAESETLDQLPLTHPEHFGNPVVGSRRGGRRSRNAGSDESSDEEDVPQKGKMKEEKEADIGKVVCVELGDKKKQKDNWFPGLVVAPTAQEVVRIRVKDEYLVRSFKDGRYFTVPKKEATEFTREIGSKVDNNTLKTAVDKALLYLDKDELPPHWDRDLLFGLEDVLTNSDSDAAFDSDSSDDEPREEKDHFVAQLYKFMDDRGTPINRGPQVAGRDIDLYKLFKVVHKLGGYNRVTNQNQWKAVSHKLGFGQILNTANLVKVSYKKFLHSFEDFYRKLGCTMVNHPRGNRARHRGGRSLIRDRDRATPVNTPRGDSKDKGSDNAECEDGDQSERRDEVTDLANDEEDVDEVTRREMKEDLPMEVNKINLTEREGSSTEDKDERPQRPQDRPPRKDGKSGATLIGKEVESSSKASPGPPPLERKPSDPQIKLVTPKGKNTKKINESSAGKSSLEAKKRVIVHKLKGARVVDEDDDEMEELDVEELEEEPEEDEGNVPVDDDGDKLTTTRSKSKDELTRLKKDVDSKAGFESERKARPLDGSERKPKPPLTAEKRSVRSINPTSEKKVKSVSQDHERKTVRSLAAEFEKKARGPGDPEKKDRGGSDTEKKGRPPSAADGEKKIRPALTATLEKKKSSTETEKKARPALGSESEKKVRPIIPADGERKKVRPSLTADPTKKNSRVDDKRKFDGDRKSTRPGDSDKDDAERKSKLDTERKVNTPDSGRLSSSADSDRKSSKSDSGDSDKKGGVKIKKDDEKKKLQIRKRKESDDISAGVDESLDKLPSYKSVSVGDRLKVYYGPTHESKVTYEAKVLEIEGEGQDAAFLVHYTGWNNRYDEWIKRSRIADNLSWSPARAKRRHQTQLTGNRKTLVKRRTITPGRDTSSPQQKDQLPSIPMLPGSEKFRDSQPPRSTTPSSVTSSSSRTKSPATRPGSARVTRNTTGETAILSSEQAARRTRTRRNSGQTDMVSESESETYESESEAEPSSTRKSNRRMALDKDDDGSKRDGVPKRKVKKQETEVEAVGDDKEDEKDEDKDDCKEDDIDASSESTSEDKAPVKRTRMGTKIVHDQKVVIKVELDDDDDDDDEGEEEEEEAAVPPNQPAKGRDFDLNQIRSELKGFDKAVKIVTDSVCEKNDSEELVELHEEKIIPTLETDEPSTDMEDIYEFKEPEPFEFDMRSKREPSVERTGKLQKRPLSRIFDDVEKSDKNIMKKKVLKTKTGDSESSEDGSPGKKRFRRTVGKKDEDLKAEELSEAPELTPEKEAIVDPATPQKKIFSTSDDAFEKLRQSPSYRFSSSPVRARTPTPSSPPTVPSPLHSPPQTSSITTLPPTLSHSINRVQSQVSVPKPIPVRITGTSGSSSKHSSQGVSSKLSSAQSVKLSSLKPVPSVVVPLIPAQMPSQPPTLVTPPSLSTDSVKISSLCLSKSSEWLDSKLGSEKQVHVPIIPKVEREECLPPLVSPSHTVRVLDRTSPEPPQLLPMFGPPSKPLHESTRQEVKEIPMPQIKKETILETDLSPQRERSESRPNIRHSIRPSVRPSVRPAVRPAIRPAVRPEARLETHTEVKPDVNLEVRAPVIRSEAACPDLENRDIPHPLIIRPDVIHVDVSRMESSCAEGTRGGALYSGTLRQEAACAESTSSEIVRHEVVRPEALRKQAVRQEAARAESLRRETAFSEVVKAEPDALKISIPEPGCAKPASQNTSAPGESSVLNLCIEAVHSEAACPEPICFESARPDSYQVETFRPEIVRVETVRPEMLRKEAVRQEAARSEAMRSEGVRQEAIRPDTLRKEAVRQEAARSESALNLRLETTCIGASRPESTHHEVLCSEAPHPDQVCQGTALPEVVCQESVYAEKLSSEAVPTAYIETVSLKVECPEVEHDEYTSDTMDIEINRSDSPILSKLSPSVNTITISPSAIKEEVPDNSESPSRRGPRRKVHMKRKKAVSKEYIFDSESDSSDEGRRLVIDKCESSDSCAESFDGRLHPVDKEGASTRKQPGHKKPEASLDLYKNSPVKKEDLSMVYTKPRDSIITAPNSVIVENAPAEVIVKCEEPEEIEVDSNLCSLLCEETIPGSPAPANDTPADAALESDSSGSAQRLQDNSKVPAGKVLEMPFASVPGNTRTPGPSTTASAGLLQHSKTGLVHHGDSSDHGKAGSSASAAGSVKQDVTEAAPVMDNTPPTTPESSISTISNSPRGERGESPPVPDNDSVKSHRDSEDTDNKDGHDSEDDLEPQSSKRSTSLKKGSQESERERDRGDAEPITSPLPKKRRRSRKTSESEERQKRPRHAANRTPVRGSDSDDNSENTAPTSIPQVPQTPVAALHSQSQAARSPRPSKYNFYVDFAPELDASQRIALLQQKLQELRKTYASVKAQLACIDRRRKKLRRREREERSSKQDVSCT